MQELNYVLYEGVNFGHGCMDDLTTELSFNWQATWVIDVLGLFL